MKCRPLRHGDQMQCPCGLAWDVDEEKPQCHNAAQIVEQVELIPKCIYCDGSGLYHGDSLFGPCVCKTHEPMSKKIDYGNSVVGLINTLKR